MKQKIAGLLVVLLIVTLAMASGYGLDWIFLYPMLMSFLWIIGGLYFYYHWEDAPRHQKKPVLKAPPFVSIIIPCYNESANVAETIAAAAAQNYPSFEIVAVNDGSPDNTGALLDDLATHYPMLRVIHLAKNQGKSMALRMGALAARSDFLVCIDGDALLDPDATLWLVKPMIDNVRVGAVAGNPRIRTRSTLLGRIQVGEFSSIIGLIKRSQRIYGNIFTVSGVIAAFRRSALQHAGYWDLSAITDDIDISWLLQLNHWQIQYEPCALCWTLMPETFRGLWKQRLRWAQGGAEVFFKNIRSFARWRNRRMWGVMLEYTMSVAWAYSFALSLFLWALGKMIPLPVSLYVPTIVPPAFMGTLLSVLCLIQFALALMIESRYEKHMRRTLGWAVWYPIVFWMLSLATTLVGFTKALLKSSHKRGLWLTVDRGYR